MSKAIRRYRLKKVLESLASKKGRGTELISLYIPPERKVSDVINYLKQEYSTATNIKSTLTRKHVLDALTKVTQRLKLYRRIPSNGLVIFCGAVSKGAPGSEEIEMYEVAPPKTISLFLYRCDDSFYLDPLRELLAERETYGVMIIDRSGATYAIVSGRRAEVLKEITSGLPGKHRAGGQSARRFERWREVETNEFYKRAAGYANNIFSSIPDLKGIILAGPGPTKYDFKDKDYLHYTLRNKILSVIDVSYTGEQGLKEVITKAPNVLRDVRYAEERELVQKFLYHLAHDTGLITYGEENVREAINKGAVRTLLLSEGLNAFRVAVKCSNCGHSESRKLTSSELFALKQTITSEKCPSCSSTSLSIIEKKELLEEFVDLAEEKGLEAQLISPETEDGQMLLKSFEGVAAILHYPLTRA
jgi:peptide chain release factor subunit 1